MADDYCNKCGMCCMNIAVDFGQKVIFRDGVEPLTDTFAQMLRPVGTRENITFCKCKYMKKNLCLNPNKPVQCTIFPSSPFAYLPEGCGYEGYIFMKNESVRQKVRKYKEEIIHYNALIESCAKKEDARQYQKIITAHQSFINRYAMYGSNDW